MSKNKEGVQPDEPTVKDYGMNTEEGNRAIEALVQAARKKANRFGTGNEKEKSALAFLRSLATKGYEEANSEEVRNKVLKEVRKR